MVRPRIIPCLLLKNRAIVKTRRFKSPHYIGDALNTIRIFSEREADELIIFDIEASLKGKLPDLGFIAEIAEECFMPFSYGGGISELQQMEKIFKLGVEKISLNTAACWNPSLIEEAAKSFGSQALVVTMDVKRSFFGEFRVMTAGGTKKTPYDPVTFAHMMEDKGAGEIVVYSIDRDGTFKGFDVELVRQVTDAVEVPVIASGGAGSFDDIEKILNLGGAAAAALGSLVVYQGNNRSVLVNYPDNTRFSRSRLPESGARP